MRIKTLRVLLMLVSFAILNIAVADQKIKTKSNIKNDRVQQPASSADCSGEAGVVVDCVKTEEDKSVTKDAVDADLKKSQSVSSSSSSDNANKTDNTN